MEHCSRYRLAEPWSWEEHRSLRLAVRRICGIPCRIPKWRRNALDVDNLRCTAKIVCSFCPELRGRPDRPCTGDVSGIRRHSEANRTRAFLRCTTVRRCSTVPPRFRSNTSSTACNWFRDWRFRKATRSVRFGMEDSCYSCRRNLPSKGNRNAR